MDGNIWATITMRKYACNPDLRVYRAVNPGFQVVPVYVVRVTILILVVVLQNLSVTLTA